MDNERYVICGDAGPQLPQECEAQAVRLHLYGPADDHKITLKINDLREQMYKDVPVHVATDLTPEQIRAYRIADNKTADLAVWDYELLPIELSELQGMDIDWQLLGFSQDDMAKLLDPGVKDGLTDPDEVPEPPDEAILDRDKHPQWQGERTKMVYAFPTNEDLWAKYAEIRSEGLRAERGLADATEFYGQHREAMDAGAVIAWPERYNHDELSAVQHAMNLKLQDERAFWAEYQNEPLPEETPQEDELTVDQVAAKINRMCRGDVPVGCNHLTMFVDVQATLLFYVVTAWEDDFTGYVIDYGAYPDQKRGYFTLRDAQPTLSQVAKGAGLEGAIYAGLEELANRCMGREWHRDDGANMRIERCLIDANWGSSTDVVCQFCRQNAHSAVLLPSHGRFVGASSIPFSEYKRKLGDRVGLNWRIPNVQGKRAVRHVLFDTNYWKSFIHARLAVAMGDRGCLSLFGDNAATHRLFAEHITAEYRVKTEGRGRTVDEWKLRAAAVDNHWLDCLVGCAVAASIQGAILPGTDMRQSHRRPKLRLSELQRGKR